MGRRWLDRGVIAGLVFLIGFPPIAFGAVHRNALILTETVSFTLIVLWMGKVCQEGAWRFGGAASQAVEPREIGRVALPMLALTILFSFELMPLPAPVMRLAAPANYQLYRVGFPGWPIAAPYQGLAVSAHHASGHQATDAARASLLPSREATSWRLFPDPSRWRWRSLAIAPGSAAGDLLEWLALAAIFFLVMLYPFGFVGERAAEARFYRWMIVSVLLAAATVASIGLAERAWWNGKLLWFYIPGDWDPASVTSSPRASGPFVDPDHFANYLAMVLPLAVVSTFFPLKTFRQARRVDLQMFAGLSALMIAAAILFSLSRAGWIAAVTGAGVALMLCIRNAQILGPVLIRKLGRHAAVVLPLSLVIGLLILVLATGPATRTDAATRVGSAITAGDDTRYRPAVWRDTLGMIRDFPLFGVGLGGWPDLFPHYQRPPWMPFFFREAENDYLQFAVETGVAGVALMAWVGIAMTAVIRRGVAHFGEREWPLFAALVGGIAAMIVHEGFDFSLHTPANAVLFTILLALAVRISIVEGAPRQVANVRLAARSVRWSYLAAVCGAIAACALIGAVYAQAGASYPYDISARRGPAYAARNLTSHPAMASAHLAFAEALGRGAPTELRRAELWAAVWLSPNDPVARDQYAQSLLLNGDRAAGLRQISAAVNRAPLMKAHYYLAPAMIPWLLPDEQAAVARGFARAIDDHFAGAINELATFYRDLGRLNDVGQLYDQAARGASDAGQRRDYLIKAGISYGQAGDAGAATKDLRTASRIDRGDARPYAELARSVFGPAGNLAAASAAIQEGIDNGADRFELNVALADAAEQAGDPKRAERALEQALHYGSSFEVTMRLGGLYLAHGDFGPAVLSFARATELEPNSAAAWFALGEGHERDYDYSAASQDYARARRLDPANQAYATTAADFARRVAPAEAAAPDEASSSTR